MPPVLATDDAFFDALLGEDPLGSVVRAHIHIEARLNLVLEALTPHPSHLPSLRFEQRAKVAVALGLADRILPALLALGRVRNAFAHRLNVNLTDSMVDELFRAFSSEDQETIRDAYRTIQTHLASADMPPFERAEARHKFITIAVALDKFLLVAENEARQHAVV